MNYPELDIINLSYFAHLHKNFQQVSEHTKGDLQDDKMFREWSPLTFCKASKFLHPIRNQDAI